MAVEEETDEGVNPLFLRASLSWTNCLTVSESEILRPSSPDKSDKHVKIEQENTDKLTSTLV
jgi:hypothetical protein